MKAYKRRAHRKRSSGPAARRMGVPGGHRAEEALRESERRLADIIDFLPDATFIVDNQGKVMMWNRAMERLTGIPAAEMLGKGEREYTVPFYGRKTPMLIDLLSKDPKALHYEYPEFFWQGDSLVGELFVPNLRGGGAYLWAIAKYLYDSKGNKIGAIESVRDTTERKRAEEKFAKAFHLGPVVYTISTLDEGQYVEVSDHFLKLSGYSAEEAIGHSSFELGIWADDGDRDRVKRILETGGRVVEEEIRFKSRHGRIYLMLFSAEVVAIAGVPYLVSVAIDVTERRKAEKKLRESEASYRTIFEQSPFPISLSRTGGEIVDINEASLLLLGLTRDEVIGKTAVELGVVDVPTAKSILKEFKRRDGRLDTFEARTWCPGKGVWRDSLISSRVVTVQDEPLVLSMINDISDRKQAEQEKDRLQEQLTQAQKMESVGRLAGGVAHDFNNMLSVIIGNAEMALGAVEPSHPLYKWLQDILQAGLHSADLTRQLLAFARKQPVNPRVLDLNDTVSGMLKMLRRLIGENISLSWVPGMGVWPVCLDPTQIDQLLANLLVNARDAVNKAGRILIETFNANCDQAYCLGHPDSLPGEYVVLAVSDDGCGMDRETMANIFEPFYTTKRDGQGTGLGLATVYGIVRQNNGFVDVYSECGQGTTFRIYLPKFFPVAPTGDENEKSDRVPGGSETVLLVEDEEAVLNLGQMMLKKLGYRVLPAASAEEAMQLAAEHAEEIDLLLTDIVMPDMNGKDLSECILSVKPGLKCLFISGYTADIIAHHGILAEGLHFMAKPFSFKDLAAKVREALG